MHTAQKLYHSHFVNNDFSEMMIEFIGIPFFHRTVRGFYIDAHEILYFLYHGKPSLEGGR